MTWCPNEIKTHLNCCLLYGFEVVKVRRNIFGLFWQHSIALGKSSEIFGSRWDIFGNPVHDKAKISGILCGCLKFGRSGCKESHFYSLPFGQAEASIY